MAQVTFSHIPVLLEECISGLNIKPDGIYVDCTAGGGGHSYAIASRLGGGKLIAVDQDKEAIAAAGKRLEKFGDKVKLVNSNFSEIDYILGDKKIDGALIDLGVSSYQLDNPERGFSYMADAPLDMRMDDSNTVSAYNIVNEADENDLNRIIFEWGEERFARRIASEIVKRRGKSPIKSTLELVDAIRSAVPVKYAAGGSHPAKRTFQAIRIAVNNELGVIEPTLRALTSHLLPGGRLAVITFHSLEDRIVKKTFSSLATGCTCPPDFPICVCGNKSQVKIITKKPILPSAEEIGENPRSHSAKLRVIEKL